MTYLEWLSALPGAKELNDYNPKEGQADLSQYCIIKIIKECWDPWEQTYMKPYS